MTKSRKAILQVLESAKVPLSASDVAASVSCDCDQATVYRTLHYLEDHDLATSFVLHCEKHGTERYYSAVAAAGCHHHWFHCESCHRFIDLGACSLEPVLRELENRHGLEVLSHTFFLTGICPDCRKARRTGENGKP